MAFHQSNRLFTSYEMHCISNHAQFLEIQTPLTSREGQIAWFVSRCAAPTEIQLVRDVDTFVVMRVGVDAQTYDTIEAALAAL